MSLNARVLAVILLTAFSSQLTAQTLKAYEQELPGSSIKFKMVPIPAGTFVIGSPSTESGREEDEGPQKKIAISAFWMAEHEVTFSEWDVFFKSVDVPQTGNCRGCGIAANGPVY
jgi:formylglycine-generating enzyme required for sulfatase activity